LSKYDGSSLIISIAYGSKAAGNAAEEVLVAADTFRIKITARADLSPRSEFRYA
jgi:hypothetical protein